MKTSKQNESPLMILYMVKLDFKDMPIPGKIMRSGRIVNRMDGNPYFPNPTVAYSLVRTAIEDLKQAESRIDGSKLRYMQRDRMMKNVEKLIRQLRSYVEAVADGNEEIAITSGFELCSRPKKGQQLEPTYFKHNKYFEIEGCVRLRWKALKGARQYVIEMGEDRENPQWKAIAYSTKASIDITNLIPGKQYFFRVAGLNSAGVGAFSQILRRCAG